MHKYEFAKKFEAVRGALIGTFVGILPGAGGSIASIVSYGEAKRTSKNKENFGKGEPEVLISSETANNATVGGGFVPTLLYFFMNLFLTISSFSAFSASLGGIPIVECFLEL